MKNDQKSLYLGFKHQDSPLSEILIKMNGIAYFMGDIPPSDTIAKELRSLTFGNCAYGASDCEVHPVSIKIERHEQSLTALDILHYIKAKNFQSDHIHDLDSDWIEFPGYNPGTKNDEIHNDEEEQHIFAKLEDADDEYESYSNHQKLKSMVKDKKLWYILLHPTKHNHDGIWLCDYVCLFAVGQSPQVDYLIGVVTYQVCHNLCD